MDQKLRLRVETALQANVLRVDPGVHVALAHPDVHVLAPGDPAHVRAEEHVGEKENLRSAGIAFTTSTAFPDVQQ